MNIYEQQLLANRIALDYIQRNADLNQEIAKHASERDLSRVQIQGLVMATNHAANDYLRKTAGDKTYSFTLADLDRVVDLLSDVVGTNVSLSKVASTITALNTDTHAGSRLVKLAEAGSCDEKERRTKQAKHLITGIAQKADAAGRQIKGQKTAEIAKVAEELDHLVRHVRDYIDSKNYTFADIHKYAGLLYKDKPQFAATILTKVAEKLEKLGHPYKGVLASNKELGKETFKRNGAAVPDTSVTVTNGATPIAKSLSIIHHLMEGVAEKEMMTHELASLSRFATLSEKTLGTNEAVNEYMLRDLDTAHKQFNVDASVPIHKLAGLIGTTADAVRGATFVGKGVAMAGKGLKKTTGSGITGTLVSAAPAAAKAGVLAVGLKGGQAVAEKARKGVSYGNFDSNSKDLR